MSRLSTKEARKARRAAVSCQLFFFGGDDFEGEARLLDLSFAGCRAKCQVPVAEKTRLMLSIFLPDGYSGPVRVEEAAVRWCREEVVGIEFLSIRPPQLNRLRQFLTKKK